MKAYVHQGPKTPRKARKRQRIGSRGPIMSADNVEWVNAVRVAYQIPHGRILDQCVEACRNNPHFKLTLTRP